MSRLDDIQFLDLLTRALEPKPVEPPATRLASLHQAIAEHARLHPKPVRRRVPQPPLLTRLRRPIAAFVAAMALTSAGTAAAIGTGAVRLPRPVRAVAHGVGLPVDSPELADARSATALLRSALGHNDSDSVAVATQELNTMLDRLSDGDRSKIEDEAHSLLEQADRLIKSEEVSGQRQNRSGDPTPAGSRTNEDGEIEDDESDDDHSGPGKDSPSQPSTTIRSGNSGSGSGSGSEDSGSGGSGSSGSGDSKHKESEPEEPETHEQDGPEDHK